MIKAILFDFDGTLIDTNELIFESYRVAFKTVLNREIGMDEMLTLYGKPLFSSLMQYGEAGKRLYEVYREFNERNHDFIAKPFGGVYEGVKMLRDNGFLIGIVTSKRLHLVNRGIEKILNMGGLFDLIVTPDDTEKTKPDPEPVLYACKKLNVAPDDAIFVGDSVFDMQAGRAAGTKLCAVKYSVTKPEQLMEFEPEYYVNSIAEFAREVIGEK